MKAVILQLLAELEAAIQAGDMAKALAAAGQLRQHVEASSTDDPPPQPPGGPV